MTGKPKARLTPQQKTLIRKMREMDEAAPREPERVLRRTYRRELTCAAVVVLVLILLALGVWWAFCNAMENIGAAIAHGFPGHG